MARRYSFLSVEKRHFERPLIKFVCEGALCLKGLGQNREATATSSFLYLITRRCYLRIGSNFLWQVDLLVYHNFRYLFTTRLIHESHCVRVPGNRIGAVKF
jgi:hypothetical protein